MTLLAWDLDALETFPYCEFRGNERQTKIIGMVNDLLLEKNSISPEPRLATLVKVMKWFQTRLADRNVVFPKMGDDSLGCLTMEKLWDGAGGFT